MLQEVVLLCSFLREDVSVARKLLDGCYVLSCGSCDRNENGIYLRHLCEKGVALFGLRCVVPAHGAL